MAIAWFAGAATLVLMLGTLVLRYLGVGVAYAADISGFLMVAIIFFGLGEVTRRREHIRADFLVAMLSPRRRAQIDWGVLVLLVLPYTAALFWVAWTITAQSFTGGIRSTGAMALPLYLPQGFMVVGLAIMLLRVVVDVLSGPRDPEPDAVAPFDP